MKLYSTINVKKHRNVVELKNPQDPAALKNSLHSYLAMFLPPGANVNKEDFFGLGLDSLQTMELTNRLKARLNPHLGPADRRQVTAKMIYANPALDKLSTATPTTRRVKKPKQSA